MSTRTTTRSEDIFARAQKLIPGGVSSPVRAFQAVGGSPPVIERGSGAHIWDVDGNKYLDFVCSWGPLILGHCNPKVTDAIVKAAQNGTTFGAPCEAELGLAERVTRLYPFIDQVRFVSSGTEATMSAIRVARGCTGRDYLVKFAGCYHGHADHLLVEAGSGLVTFGQPASAGVPKAFAEKTLVLPLDDIDALEALFAERGSEIAAVIVEPLPANNGLLKQTPEFLAAVRRVTKEHGALLIYDEVINGFRLAPGGAAELYHIDPDLATFGKVIGGGLPVGAFGGKAEYMQQLAPLGPIYQAGTLSGNPLAMAAGIAAVDFLIDNNGWDRLEELGAYFEAQVAPLLEARGWSLVRQGSVFWFSLQQGPAPRSASAIDTQAADRYRPIFHGLLKRGINMAPSAYEVGFVSLAHTEADIDFFTSQLAEVLNSL
jgi:glutamate-1-semialdehyde 2,1-aminomutase